jgi:hypothetical protein
MPRLVDKSLAAALAHIHSLLVCCVRRVIGRLLGVHSVDAAA